MSSGMLNFIQLVSQMYEQLAQKLIRDSVATSQCEYKMSVRVSGVLKKFDALVGVSYSVTPCIAAMIAASLRCRCTLIIAIQVRERWWSM